MEDQGIINNLDDDERDFQSYVSSNKGPKIILGKKKKTKKKVKADMLGRGKRKVKVPSWGESMLKKLIKRRKEIGNNMQAFAAAYVKEGNLSEIDDREQEFYFQFYNALTDVKRLPMARHLITKKILIPVCQRDVKLTFITNDSLFWYSSISKFSSLVYSKSFIDISYIYLTSNNLIIYEDKTKLYDRYIEDFNVNVSSPAWKKDVTTKVEDFKQIENSEFSFYGIKYSVYEVKDNGNVYKAETVDTKKALEFLNDAKVINSKGGQLSSGVREIEKMGNFFYNGKIKLTNFCPETIGNFPTTSFTALCFFELDPNSFIQLCNEKKKFMYVPNFFYWDYLNSSMELIGIMMFLANSEINEDLRKLYNLYIDNKALFNIYKAHFNLFKRVIMMFIDSFRIRASIDRMNEIYDLCNKYLTEHNRLSKFSEERNIIINFVTSKGIQDKAAAMMNNYIFGLPEKYVQIIKDVCALSINPQVDIGNLADKLRSVCLKVGDLMFNGSSPMIDSIRSVNSFLGTISGGNYSTIKNLAEQLWTNSNAIKEEKKEQKKALRNARNEGIQSVLKDQDDIYYDMVMNSPERSETSQQIYRYVNENFNKEHKNQKYKTIVDFLYKKGKDYTTFKNNVLIPILEDDATFKDKFFANRGMNDYNNFIEKDWRNYPQNQQKIKIKLEEKKEEKKKEEEGKKEEESEESEEEDQKEEDIAKVDTSISQKSGRGKPKANIRFKTSKVSQKKKDDDDDMEVEGK